MAPSPSPLWQMWHLSYTIIYNHHLNNAKLSSISTNATSGQVGVTVTVAGLCYSRLLVLLSARANSPSGWSRQASVRRGCYYMYNWFSTPLTTCTCIVGVKGSRGYSIQTVTIAIWVHVLPHGTYSLLCWIYTIRCCAFDLYAFHGTDNISSWVHVAMVMCLFMI